MKAPMVLLFAVLAACGTIPPQSRDNSPISGKGRALDGDTISLDFRLSGADAFERKQMCARGETCYPCGKFAQDSMATMLRSGDVTVRPVGSTSYGRPVVIVTIDGDDLGEQLIGQGLAMPALEFLGRDPARAARYSRAAQQAKAQERGAYTGQWIEPKRWRRGERLACERRY